MRSAPAPTPPADPSGPPARARARVRGVSRALGALLAVLATVVLLTGGVAAPAHAGAVGTDPAPTDPASPVVSGVVTATASCLAPDPRDTVAVDVAGMRREMPLESCGNRVGTRVAVRVGAGDTGGGAASSSGEVARVAGVGADGREVGATPPAADRLSVLLAVVAAIGGAVLLVAVGRERRRGPPRPRVAHPR